MPVRKAGKLPRETHAVSYDLEYGQATLEMHRDALAPGRAGAARRRRAGHRRHAGGDPAAGRALRRVVHGVAVLMELSFLPGRDAVGDLPFTGLLTRLTGRSWHGLDWRDGRGAPRAPADAPSARPRAVAGRGAGCAPGWPGSGTKSQSGNPVLEPLFHAVRANHPKADLELLERAYLTAEQHHASQMRKSGDPYITHPLAVTTILADIGMTEPTLVAALLHDTVEDTPYTLEELRADFGDEVALLVDGVTKLDKVKYGDAAQAETIRKMIVAMARDIRVLVIKLADRLHNMRTLRYVKPRPRSGRPARPSTSTPRWRTGSA